MAFCEAGGIDYLFGLSTNGVLRTDAVIVAVTDACAIRSAIECWVALHTYNTKTRCGAKGWQCQRRVAARIEINMLGFDRYVVTSLTLGLIEYIYDKRNRSRVQSENLITLYGAGDG